MRVSQGRCNFDSSTSDSLDVRPMGSESKLCLQLKGANIIITLTFRASIHTRIWQVNTLPYEESQHYLRTFRRVQFQCQAWAHQHDKRVRQLLDGERRIWCLNGNRTNKNPLASFCRACI